MLEKVQKTIARFGMLSPGDRVIVAVSGGPDSTALLYILYCLREDLGLDLTVVHLDHMLRGEESYQDACHVQALAKSLGVPAVIKRVDVSAYHRQRGGSLQAVAREVRYQLFRQVARDLGGGKVALGHNRDDQVETVLMRLLRGTGLQGLAGIPPVRLEEPGAEIIRPLLEVTREEILAYCQEQGLPFRWDPSNEKPVYFRNKIRLQLIPWLLAEFSPSLKSVLAENALLWREEHDYLEGEAREWYLKHRTLAETGQISLALTPLQMLAKVILRRVLRRAIGEGKGDLEDIQQVHLESAVELVQRGRVGSYLMLPGGIRLERGYQEIIIGEGREDKPGSFPLCYSLPVPGKLVLPDLGLCLVTRLKDRRSLEERDGTPWRVLADYDRISLPLLVRNRRAGDRFHPAGMDGSKKLKDFFIDAKIPRLERDVVPLVTTSRGEILWVVGYRQDARFRVGEDTERVLVIEVDSMKGEKGFNAERDKRGSDSA